MAEILPFRSAKRWSSARVYVAPKPRRRARGGWGRAARELGAILWALPLALLIGVFLAERGIAAWGGWLAPPTTAQDRLSAQFGLCGWDVTNNCVIDGDTFWFRGEKIRVADINTPETSDSKCAAEAELGARATARFTQLLNAGAFSLEPVDRARDSYGRALFVVTRGGESVGGTLVREGLAEEWRGYRRDWC